VKEYFNEPRRGYGQQVVDIFHKLRAQKFVDPFGPAKEQFDGSGSYGNGGAMRVAPVALFCHSNYEELVRLAQRSAELTHTHKQGYDGAILQVNRRPHVFVKGSKGTI
jgi:poly(ADP-ribose) glycohydrolase ARH3